MDFNPDAYLASQGLDQAEGAQPATQQPSAPTQQAESFDPDAYLAGVNAQSPAETAKAAGEGALRGVLGPLGPVVEHHLLEVPYENILEREKAHPIAHGAGEAAGFLGSALTGTGEAAVMEGAGKLAQKATGLGELAKEAPLIHRVGSEAVKQAVEMTVMTSLDETSKMLLRDPDTSAESAIANIGLSAVLGGATGAAFTGAISPFWKATVGPKIESVFKGLRSSLDRETTSTLRQEAEALGLGEKFSRDLEGAMSDNPILRNAASGLEQTDTSALARGFQQRSAALRDAVEEKAAETFGRSVEDVNAIDTSKAVSGKNVGTNLAQEHAEMMDPIKQELNAIEKKIGNPELTKAGVVYHKIEVPVEDLATGGIRFETKVEKKVIPGFIDNLHNKLMEMADKEKWITARGTPEAQKFLGFVRDLKNINTLGKLINTSKKFGANTAGIDPVVKRMGSMVRDAVREVQTSFIIGKLGKDAPELVSKYQDTLSRFHQIAKLSDELDERLKTGARASSFSKAVGEMAKTDSETLLSRLSGVKDAHLLDFLSQNYPKTAEALRQHHLDLLLESAKHKGSFSLSTLATKINGMEPEMRNFVVGNKGDQINRLQTFITRLDDANHNHSKTARVLDKVLSMPGVSAIGLMAAMAGHSGLGLMAPIASIIGKEGTAATRLAMLTFLASEKPVSAEGIKATTSMASAVIKGESTLSKSVTALFKGGLASLPSYAEPTAAQLEKLDRLVAEQQEKPQAQQMVAGDTPLGHYAPDHQQAVTAASLRTAQYLANLKPKAYRSSPLDREIEPTPAQEARYNRALTIAEQPMILLKHIKYGTLQASDVQDINAMYPSLYQNMSQKIANQMQNHHAEDGAISYATRMSMSLFLGQPLDSSMQPMSIMAAQPKPQGPPVQGNKKPGKAGAGKLEKSNKMYQTPGQNAELDRSTRD